MPSNARGAVPLRSAWYSDTRRRLGAASVLDILPGASTPLVNEFARDWLFPAAEPSGGGITATGLSTPAPVLLTATARVRVKASGSLTVDAAVLVAAARARVKGVLGVLPGAVTMSSAGRVRVKAQSAMSVGAVTLVASATTGGGGGGPPNMPPQRLARGTARMGTLMS